MKSKSINSTLVAALFTLAICSQTLAATPTAKPLNIDNAHSELGFKITNLVISKVRGRFDKWTGSLLIDEKAQKVSDLKIEVDTSSINTNDDGRDKHLRNEDFFNVSKFPKAHFKSAGFSLKKGKVVSMDGELTMLGVSKKQRLDVEFVGSQTDPWGTTKYVFEVRGKIKRSDFGMVWNKTLDTGGVFISDDVDLEINVQADQKSEEKSN